MKTETLIPITVRISATTRDRIRQFRSLHPMRPAVQVIVNRALEAYLDAQSPAKPKKGRAA